MDFHENSICSLKFNSAHVHRWDLRNNIHAKIKRNRTKTVYMEASIPYPSLWRLGTLSDQSEEKLEEYQGTARDAAITVRRHVSPLRGKGWVIHN